MRATEQELRDMLAALVARFDSMPDAGLTADDPRCQWYIESFALRTQAHLLLGDRSWGSVHGRAQPEWVRDP